MHNTLWATGTAALILSGCTVGPDYKGPPRVIAETNHGFVRGANVQAVDKQLDPRWWVALKDPELDRLEMAAVAANADLAAARARLRQSRAQLRAQQADLLPKTGTSALYLHTHGGTGAIDSSILGGSPSLATAPGAAATGDTSSLGGSNNDLNLYDVGFDATWEIDLFGAQRRAVQSAAASAQARQADVADTLVSLTADVAQAYISLRDVQHRAKLAQASADLQTRTLALTLRRQEGGTASSLDIDRLTTQVEQTKADLVPLKGQIDEQLDRLAILTGHIPGELDADLVLGGTVPLPPATVAVGDPASLLRRRPDIRSAERQIAAQNALIGEHLADYFPKVELLGNIGFVSTDIGQLFNGNAFAAVVAPVLQWKPFDFGRTHAAVDQARARPRRSARKLPGHRAEGARRRGNIVGPLWHTTGRRACAATRHGLGGPRSTPATATLRRRHRDLDRYARYGKAEGLRRTGPGTGASRVDAGLCRASEKSWAWLGVRRRQEKIGGDEPSPPNPPSLIRTRPCIMTGGLGDRLGPPNFY